MEALLVLLLLAVLVVVVFLALMLRGPLQDVRLMKVELRGVGERVSGVERMQSAAGQNLTVLHAEVSAARSGVSQMHGQAEARGLTDRQVAESVRRLEATIAGTYSKGAAGENIINVMFSKLPVEWQLRDFRVGNRTVEFALRMSNKRVLPIDSKWPATDLVERLAASTDPAERQHLKDQIGRSVVAKAREVKKYLEPSLTMGFGIAAVPDAVYELSTEVHGVCLQENVVLIGYSMFLPYVLLVFQTVLANSKDVDLEKLNTNLQTAEASVVTLQQELEGRFSKAITMLQNSKADLSAQLSRLDSSLTNVHIGTGVPRELEASQAALMLETGQDP